MAAKAKTPASKRFVPTSAERVGVLGGTFNPIHIGHLNSALTVKEKLQLDKVLLTPSFKPPHREISGPGVEDRAELVRAAIKPYQPELELDDQEIKRGGVSYSIETLKFLNRTYRPENIYFIMGADAFVDFPQWKDFSELLKLSNFVITTRPGTPLSLEADDLPEGLESFVRLVLPDKLILKTGREIISMELDDIEASATEIRKKLRAGHDTKKWLTPAVSEIINRKGLYKRSSPLVADYRDFSILCGTLASDKKALDIKVYDMSKKNSYADYSVICSATSSRHASSIADGILAKVKEDIGLAPISLEGMRDGHWVLIDYGAVVVHVFQDAVRAQYKIEDLWRSCPQIQKVEKAAPAKKNIKQEARGSRA